MGRERDPTDRAPVAVRHEPTIRQRSFAVYVCLTLAICGTAAFTVWTGHAMMSRNTTALRVDREWASRMERCRELELLSSRASAAIPDYFLSQDDADRGRFETAGSTMTRRLDDLTSQFLQLPFTHRGALERFMNIVRARHESRMAQGRAFFAIAEEGEESVAPLLEQSAAKADEVRDAIRLLHNQLAKLRSAETDTRRLQSEQAVLHLEVAALIIVLLLIGMVIHGTVLRTQVRREAHAREHSQNERDSMASRNRMILDVVAEGILAFRPDGRVVQSNPAAHRLFGCDEDELQENGNVVALLPGFVATASQDAFEAKCEGPTELTSVRPDGSEFPAHVAVARSPESDGVLFAATVRDLTESKRNERELVDARLTAERATEVKSRFLANMSHEIRTPLNGVIGMAELLTESDLDVEQREYTGVIRASAESLLGLINDILDFSKIEAGMLEMEDIEFDLGAAVEDAAILVARDAQKKGVEVIVEIRDSLPDLIAGDPIRIGQVILNLVRNAVKFTTQGYVRLVCTGSDVVRIAIEDTGCGIPKDAVGRLFEPFSQVDASTTRHFGGTGLGLAISHQIVEAMGGRITVESEVGAGSCFAVEWTPRLVRAVRPLDARLTGTRVYVAGRDETAAALRHAVRRLGCEITENPTESTTIVAGTECENAPSIARTILHCTWSELSQANRDGIAVLPRPPRIGDLETALIAAQTPTAPIVERPTSVRTQYPDSRVLLVEDNRVNQRVAQKFLESHGIDIEIACNGAEAVARVKVRTFDLIFMDCRMPVMDGFEATRTIRKINHARMTPIVALTAQAMEGDREACLDAGMTDYITKPLRREDLATSLTRHLDQTGATSGEPR